MQHTNCGIPTPMARAPVGDTMTGSSSATVDRLATVIVGLADSHASHHNGQADSHSDASDLENDVCHSATQPDELMARDDYAFADGAQSAPGSAVCTTPYGPTSLDRATDDYLGARP